jgi:hypothetical protein
MITFFNVKNICLAEIYRQACEVYAMSDGMVRSWCRMFSEGGRMATMMIEVAARP